MITEQSKRNLKAAFHKAVLANVVRETGDVCDIAPAALREVGMHPAEKVLLVTLSSFVFRLLIIFRIAETEATLSYYSRVGTAQTLEDVFAELANRCAGTLSRNLSSSFPHLAISTPCSVSGGCIEFISEMNPQYTTTCQITINTAVKLQAVLCLCCFAPLEVPDGAAAAAELIGGELEMF